MASISARVLRKVLSHLDEGKSESFVRRMASILSVSEPEHHADLIKGFQDEFADELSKQRIGAFANIVGNVTAEDRRAFMQAQAASADLPVRESYFAGQGALMPPPTDPLPSFDVETAINNLDVFFLGHKGATKLGEFGRAVEHVLEDRRVSGEAPATPHEPPIFSPRRVGDRNITAPSAVELPTGTVLEILSDPNPARKGTMHAIEQEVEKSTRAFVKHAGEENPLFLFDEKERKALESLFSTDPENRGALVQILDPETPPTLEGALREVLQPGGTPGKGNNFVQILDGAGLPGALIAKRAGAPGHTRDARMRYIATVFDYLEGNRFPRVTTHQRAWATYNNKRRSIKDFYSFRALPDPGADEAIVPPAVGLTQTVVDLMRKHDPKLLARDILNPRKGDAIAAALDEIRPPQYGLPKVPVRQQVGDSATTIDSHLLPLSSPSFDTNFKRELPSGQIVRLNPTAKLTKDILPDPLPPGEDLYLVVDELAFLGAASNKPEKTVALVRLVNVLDPTRGGTSEEGSILFLASPKKGGFPFGPVELAELPELAGLLRDDQRVPLARNLAKDLRQRFAPTIDQLGERGENLFIISEPDGRPLNFTSERSHALVAANQGLFVTAEPFGKLASFEAKRGMPLDQTTVYARLTTAKQRVSLRHAEDLFTEYSDIASFDQATRHKARVHLARSLLMNEKTLVKHTNTLGARMVGRLFRLEEAIEDLPRNEAGRVLARKMRQRAAREAAVEPGTLERPLSLESLQESVSKKGKELPIGGFTEESLDEAAQGYFSAADDIRLFREMRSAQAKMSLAQEMARVTGEAPDMRAVVKALPAELRKLANQRGMSAALDTAQSASEGGLPTSEIRQQARNILLANPDLMGHTAAERARASRMLAAHAERATRGMPFGVAVERVAENKLRQVDPRFQFKKLPYEARKMIRQQFLDQASEDPATFLTDFLAAHVANETRRGLTNVNVNISYLDDGLPNITIHGYDPKSGQMIRRAVPLSSDNLIAFQGVVPGNWSSAPLWEEFEQRLRNDPMLGGICNLGDVTTGT